MRVEQENNIIGAIYEAALDPSLWPRVVKEIVEYTESKTAIFTALDQLNPNADFIHTCNISDECLKAYSDERIKVIDMKLHLPLWQQTGVGETIHQDLLHYKNSDNSDEEVFYKRCLEPTGISKIAGVLLDQSEYRWAVLGVHRAPDDLDYEPEIFSFLTRIGAHIRRALQIHKQLSLLKSENYTMHKMLDSIKIGILLVDQYHQLHYSNQRAQQLLHNSQLFYFDKNNRIYVNSSDQIKFETLLNNTIQKDMDSFELGGVLSLISSSGEQFMITVSPFHNVDVISLTADQENHYAAIFMTKTDEKHQLASQYLKDQYGLAPRECEVCELFVNGFSFDEIAKFCHLTLGSVRTYFKSIYFKLGCNSQTDLLHKLMSMTINFQHIS